MKHNKRPRSYFETGAVVAWLLVLVLDGFSQSPTRNEGTAVEERQRIAEANENAAARRQKETDEYQRHYGREFEEQDFAAKSGNIERLISALKSDDVVVLYHAIKLVDGFPAASRIRFLRAALVSDYWKIPVFSGSNLVYSGFHLECRRLLKMELKRDFLRVNLSSREVRTALVSELEEISRSEIAKESTGKSAINVATRTSGQTAQVGRKEFNESKAPESKKIDEPNSAAKDLATANQWIFWALVPVLSAIGWMMWRARDRSRNKPKGS